jgi:hypothetical protein
MLQRKPILLFILFLSLLSCGEGSGNNDSLIKSNSQSSSGPTPLSLLTPQDSTYGEGSTLDFQIRYNDIVTVTGTPCLILEIGGSSRSACYQRGSGTFFIIF